MPPENLTEALKTHSNKLLEFSDSFKKTSLFTEHAIDVCTYYESRTIAGLGEEVIYERSTIACLITHCLCTRPLPKPRRFYTTKMSGE